MSTAPFTHTTIETQYHALYSADFWTRFNAQDAESERQMRECMGNRDNYDLEAVRSVVAHHEATCPRSHRAAVARAVLAERLAELAAPVSTLPGTQFVTTDGDVYQATRKGAGHWLLSWPEGDLEFYGTLKQALTRLHSIAKTLAA